MSENTKSKMTEKKEQRKRLEQQIRFIIEADKVKSVFRQTYLADGSRKENDEIGRASCRERVSHRV